MSPFGHDHLATRDLALQEKILLTEEFVEKLRECRLLQI